ncbi:hypothetical protein [Thauera aromatica]|nr:hypothetical protein [Thauera aromatica]
MQKVVRPQPDLRDTTDPVKTSLRLKRKRVAWDGDIRKKMLWIHS